MRARGGAAFAVAILALALGVSACGGGGSTKTTTSAAERVAEAHWRAGLAHWHRSMASALTRISVVFSTDAGVVSIESARSRGFRQLVRDERTLAACTTAIGQLGPAPRELALARAYALRACRNLERGEKLIEVAVRQVRTSTPLNPLGPASGPLSTGEAEMSSAAVALKAGTG